MYALCRSRVLLGTAVLVCSWNAAFARQDAAQGNAAVQGSGPAAAITFTRDWPKGQPPYYSIVVRANGSAEYVSQAAPPFNDLQNAQAAGSDSPDSATQPYSTGFTLGLAATQRIFSLAQQANFFNGSFNYDRHKVADTGKKTLAYSDGSRSFQTSYNWSENNAIDNLTHTFEGISLTLESGEQLRHLMRFDKLGLNAQLAGMEQAAGAGEMREIQLIAPVLNEIASDSAYMHIAQQRARHLLSIAAR